MQFSYSRTLLKPSPALKIAAFGLKLVILLGCCYFIFQKLASQSDQLQLVLDRFTSMTPRIFGTICLVLLLMGINWSLEAFKWQILVHDERIGWRKSVNATLAAIAVGSATPRSIGDFVGRAMIVDARLWRRMVVPTLAGRLAQLIPTLLFGCIGLVVILDSVPIHISSIIWFAALMVAAVSGLFLFKWMGQKWSIWRRFGSRITRGRIFAAFLIAVSRYFVFGFQFFLLLKVFGTEANTFMLVAGITWVFLAKSAIPSFNFLSDLGVREFSATLFFSSFNISIVPVVCASLTLWLINILLPTTLGLFIISTKKSTL